MARIIVVDDDKSTTTLVQMLLEMDGHTVITCASADEALARADNGVAAFIVDYYLGGGKNGIELLNSIREGHAAVASDTTVILVSGDARLQENAREAGADLFLLKPYSTKELSEQIARLIPGS